MSGLAFIAFALWTLRGDTLDEEDKQKIEQSQGSVILTVGGLFMLSELGDKTMLATVTLATEHGLFGTWLGSTLGMVAADAIAIAIGRVAGDRLPERAHPNRRRRAVRADRDRLVDRGRDRLS